MGRFVLDWLGIIRHSYNTLASYAYFNNKRLVTPCSKRVTYQKTAVVFMRTYRRQEDRWSNWEDNVSFNYTPITMSSTTLQYLFNEVSDAKLGVQHTYNCTIQVNVKLNRRQLLPDRMSSLDRKQHTDTIECLRLVTGNA